MGTGHNPKNKQVKYFSILFLLIPLTLAAQSKSDSLQAMSDARILNTYSLTSNAATLWLLPLPDYGKVNIDFSNNSGNFKRPLQPGGITNLKAGAEGWKKQKKLGYRGSFTYEKRYDSDLGWTNEFNPYNGNHFLWADSSNGDWIKDHIYAQVDISASPLKNVLFSGVQMNYHVGTGARTNDPKPFYLYRTISVKPGFLLKLSENSHTGVTIGATSVLENNELGFYNRGTNNVLLYRLRGYGTYSRVPFVSGERTRKGNFWDAGAHWQKKVNGFVLLLFGKSRFRNETITEGIAKPETIGNFREISWDGGILASSGNETKGTSLLLTFKSDKGTGKDQIFQAENAVYANQTFSGKYQWWKYKRGLMVKGTFEPFFDNYSQSDKAAGSKFSVNTLGGSVGYTVRKKFPDKTQLEINPNLLYSHILKSTYFSQNNNVILREIVRKNYDFMASSYLSAEMGIRYNIFSKKGGHSISAKVNFIKELSYKLYRNHYQLGYSFLF